MGRPKLKARDKPLCVAQGRGRGHEAGVGAPPATHRHQYGKRRAQRIAAGTWAAGSRRRA